MYTTQKYLLDQELFDPIYFNDPSINELEIKLSTKDSEASSIVKYLINEKGRVAYVEKGVGKWTAYPPMASQNEVKNKTVERVLEEYIYSNHGRLIKIQTTDIETGKEKSTKHLLYENGYLVGTNEKGLRSTFYRESNGDLIKREISFDVPYLYTSQMNMIFERNELGQIVKRKREFIVNVAYDTEHLITIGTFNYNHASQLESLLTEVISDEKVIIETKFEYLNNVDDLIRKVSYIENKKLRNEDEFVYNKAKQLVGKIEISHEQNLELRFDYIRR